MRKAVITVAGAGMFLVGELTDRDGQRLRLSVSENIEFDRTAGRQFRYLAGAIAGVCDQYAVRAGNDAPGPDPGLCSWTSFLRPVNQRTFGFLHPKAIGNATGYRLNLDAEPPARDGSLVLQFGNDLLGGLRRNIKANADRTA